MYRRSNKRDFNRIETYLLQFPKPILNYLVESKLVSNNVLRSSKEIFSFFGIRYEEKRLFLSLEWDQAPPGYFTVRFNTKTDYHAIRENITKSYRTKTRKCTGVIFVLTEQIDRFITEYKNNSHIEWEYISKEPNIEWTNKTVNELRDILNWKFLYKNHSVKWNFELLRDNQNLIDWKMIISKPYLFWTIESINEFKTHLNFTNWNVFFDGSRFTRYEYLTEKFGPYRYFNVSISLAWNVNWNFELIDQFKNLWDWNELSANPFIRWNEYLINLYSDRISFKYLSLNRGVIWSEYIIEKYCDRWDWEYLSGNPNLPWNFNFIKKYENKWTWKPTGYLEDNYKDNNKGMYRNSISTNTGIIWDCEMIHEWEKHIDNFRIAYCGRLKAETIINFYEMFYRREITEFRYDRSSDWRADVDIYRTGWENLALNDKFYLTKKIIVFLHATKITLNVPIGNFADNGYYEDQEFNLLEILRNNSLKNITLQDIIENENGWAKVLLNEDFINETIAEKFIKPIFTEKYTLKYLRKCYNKFIHQ